jgi:hypothetical protein
MYSGVVIRANQNQIVFVIFTSPAQPMNVVAVAYVVSVLYHRTPKTYLALALV